MIVSQKRFQLLQTSIFFDKALLLNSFIFVHKENAQHLYILIYKQHKRKDLR